jgi:hypothetical protein
MKRIGQIAIVAVVMLLSAVGASAQGWTHVGNFPNSKYVIATSKTGPANSTPFWRGWQRLVYNPVQGGVMATFGNPNCCGGVYGNAIFVYSVGTNTWQMLWSHTTPTGSSTLGQRPITAISRSNGVVSVALQQSLNWPFDPTINIAAGIRNVSDPSFNVGPLLVTLVDQTHFTFPQAGPDATPTCGSTCGAAFGVFGTTDAPADGHQYAGKVWDTNRNKFWIAFGTGAASVSRTGGFGTDSESHDMYSMDTSSGVGVWTQTCGDFSGRCTHPGDQESAMTYDSVADKMIMAGGLYSGTASAQTWEFTPSINVWSQVCTDPPGKTACPIPFLDGPGLVYDPALGVSVLFGGNQKANVPNTATWLFNSATNTWSQANTTTHPPSVRFPVMDYVPSLGEVVLIGAESTGGHVWAFDGDWHDLGITPGPNLTSAPSTAQTLGAYDQTAQRFVLMMQNAQTGAQIWSLQF